MDVIIDQPECEHLYDFEGRRCEEIFELEMFRDVDQAIIKEKAHRFGGKFTCTINFHAYKTYTNAEIVFFKFAPKIY